MARSKPLALRYRRRLWQTLRTVERESEPLANRDLKILVTSHDFVRRSMARELIVLRRLVREFAGPEPKGAKR